MSHPCGNAPPKLTKWEAGNEVVAAADALSRAIVELKDWPQLQSAAKEARRVLVDKYIEQGMIGEMGFGI